MFGVLGLWFGNVGIGMQGLRLSRLRDTEPLGLVTRTGPQQLKYRLGFHRASEKKHICKRSCFLRTLQQKFNVLHDYKYMGDNVSGFWVRATEGFFSIGLHMSIWPWEG